MNEVPDLADYYRAEVSGGPGAFVEVAHDYEDFAEAMKRKLRREIEWRPQVSNASAGEGAAATAERREGRAAR